VRLTDKLSVVVKSRLTLTLLTVFAQSLLFAYIQNRRRMTETQQWNLVFYQNKKAVASTTINTTQEAVKELSNWLVNNQEDIPMFAFEYDEIGCIKCFDFIPIANYKATWRN
jgi:hypothetical protein